MKNILNGVESIAAKEMERFKGKGTREIWNAASMGCGVSAQAKVNALVREMGQFEGSKVSIDFWDDEVENLLIYKETKTSLNLLPSIWNVNLLFLACEVELGNKVTFFYMN